MATPNIAAYNNFSATVYVAPSLPEVSAPFRLRASSVGLNAKQEVSFPDLIDGAIDRTAYGLGGNMIEGDLAFPMIHEGQALGLTGPKANCSSFNTSLAQSVWKMAAARTAQGRLKYSADITVVYPDNAQFTYENCYLNNLGMKVTQQANVDITTSWIGIDKTPTTLAPSTFNTSYLSPARIVNWSDFEILCYSAGTSQRIVGDITGEGFREFNVTLNNNIERAFTFNGSLNPQDVYAKKRQLNGTLKLMGRSKYLNKMGMENQNYFTSDEHIAFGYRIGNGNIYWATVLHGVIYKPEEMTLNPSDLFESTIAFEAAGDCGFSFEGTQLGTNLNQASLSRASSSSYGGPTRDTQAGYTPFDGWINT